MIPFDATIDEFEQGAWIADLITFDQFSGSFQLTSNGDTWTGSKVNEQFDNGMYHTRVIGGGNGLAKVIDDKFYDGSISLQSAVQAVCTDCGEQFGSAKEAVFLTPFMRIRGEAYKSLDAIANAFQLIWWIGRDGLVAMLSERPSGGAADGARVQSDTDSVTLHEPENVKLGATYETRKIRHVRWRLTKEKFSATLYFVPFIFRPPTDARYSCLYNASVDRDNGDGTIDVIAAGRFGVTKVQLYCGVPGSKVKVNPGESVTLGFFGGDPQKPFAVAMAQDTSATKKVARMGDGVGNGTLQITHAPASGPGVVPCTFSATYTPGDGGAAQNLIAGVGTFTVGEKITSGSARLEVGDA